MFSRVLLIFFLGFVAPCVGIAKPIIVTIDNPQFRRLVLAIPEFEIESNLEADDELALFRQQGASKLRALLDYTGLFNHISHVAYQGLKVKATGDVDFNQWNSLGVEALILGRIGKDISGPFLELRALDIVKRRQILGKRYRDLSASEFVPTMRRFGNWVLEAFTGKPGIYNSKIVFVGRKKRGDLKQIYVCDFDGSNVRQISNNNSTNISPHFSPDGKVVTYTSFRNRNPDLYAFNLETNSEKIMSKYQGLNSGAQWSPSGKLISYTGSKNGDTDIFTLNPETGRRKKLIRGSGLDVDPTFSPDGKYLAFVSGRYGNPHIFKATLKWNGEKNVRVVSDMRLTYAGWYNSTPAWSPDSKQIVFAGYDKHIDRYDIFIMDPMGKNLERLTLKTGDNESPSYSPNGQMIVFQSNRMGGRDIKGRPQLWIMNSDGSGQRELSTGLYEAQTPSWSNALYPTTLKL